MSACRCGTDCIRVEHEGAEHELCPKCDALTIHAIKVGEIPQMVLTDMAVSYAPTEPAPPSPRAPREPGLCKCGHPETDHEIYDLGKPWRQYDHVVKRWAVVYPLTWEHCVHCESPHVFDEQHDGYERVSALCWSCEKRASKTGDGLCSECERTLREHAEPRET